MLLNENKINGLKNDLRSYLDTWHNEHDGEITQNIKELKDNIITDAIDLFIALGENDTDRAKNIISYLMEGLDDLKNQLY